MRPHAWNAKADWSLLMKKARLFIIFITLSAAFLSGCTITAGGEQSYSYERPAAGFSAEDEATTNVDIEEQSTLGIEAQDGLIKITRWDRDYLQIVEKRKLKGPATKDSLSTMLEKNNYKVENTTYRITLKKEPDKDLKPFFRRTDDIELMVPEKLTAVNIEAKSGTISMSGFDGMTTIDLVLEKGGIKIGNCKANKIDAEIVKGDLDIAGITGSSTYKCGRGDINLRDITGSIELKSVSGNTYIENVDGMLNGDISTGSITVKASQLKTGSMLYASYGNIEADLEGLDVSGKYTIKAAKGDIRLNMPEKTGWSLLARSTKGRIIDKLGLASDDLEKAPTGEVYGDVRGGGPTIDVYVDRGDIYLQNGGS